MLPEEQSAALDIQGSAKHISFWISLFGWLYVISWICDTVVILSGETTLVNYLWFCQRGVIGISLIFFAKRIKRLPTNTVALMTVVLGILVVRAGLMVFDTKFGHWHLINLFDETSSPKAGVVCGWGTMFTLISYVWLQRRECKETQLLFPQFFNGTANLKKNNQKSSKWKYILTGTILTLLTLLIMFGYAVVQSLLEMQPFVNVTENYAVTQVQYPQDSRTPTGWTRYAIGDLATINIPPSMELRTDEQLLEKMKQSSAQMGVTATSIVFQQLGFISQSGYSKYARVMISVYEDTFDFGRDLRTLSSEEKAKLDEQEQERWRSEYDAFSKIKLLSFSKTIFGESYTQNSYTTQLGDNPIVCVNLFSFYERGKKVEIKLLHRERESEYFKEDFALIPNTFQFR